MYKKVIFLFTLFFLTTGYEAQPFNIDGFESGMDSKELKVILDKLRFDQIEKKGDSITVQDHPHKPDPRKYSFSFHNDKLFLVNKNLPPSMKNFIILFDKFTETYGKPIDFRTEISIETFGEFHYVSFTWGKEDELVTLDYSVRQDRDILSVTYEDLKVKGLESISGK